MKKLNEKEKERIVKMGKENIPSIFSGDTIILYKLYLELDERLKEVEKI